MILLLPSTSCCRVAKTCTGSRVRSLRMERYIQPECNLFQQNRARFQRSKHSPRKSGCRLMLSPQNLLEKLLCCVPSELHYGIASEVLCRRDGHDTCSRSSSFPTQ